ncbi:MAG: peptidyl-alpha-hydroxyglycine alpha-amidating lyase family protein [Acidobacteriota bacterium]|nr:peptidyl-alpha-hydroxyglycine alpha-amidating lyase family protein [Acidobacteriota bacterium]
MSGYRFLPAIFMVLICAAPALAQDKGGEDETGPYEVATGWPQPWSKAGYIWGSQPAVAQSPDRIFIGARGELKLPDTLPRGFNGIWGSLGQRTTEPTAEVRNCLVVVDRTGKLIEAWTQWDHLFEGSGPHKIRISPYDPQKHVWVVNDGKHQIHKFSNDGKQLVLTLGEAGVAGEDATHFGMPQDLAFLPDGSILVADGLRNARIAKFDKDGKFVSSFGTRGAGPGQLSGVHGIAVSKDGRIYVADRSNRRIQVFDAAGKVLDIWPNLRQPNDIFISADDRVWVVDGTNARLLQFDTEGKRLYWWGAYGVQPGQFWEPHQISVDGEGNLYIADSFGGRTQKYSPMKTGDSSKMLTLVGSGRR